MREDDGYGSPTTREREDRPRSQISGQVWFGVAIVLVGTAFLLDNLGIVNSREILRFLPLILVGAGLSQMFHARRRSQLLWGATLAALGTLLLLGSLDVLRFQVWSLWPLFLILLGIRIVTRTRSRAAADDEIVDTARVADLACLGGVERSIASSAFEGGNATAFMGGVELDLRRSKLAGRTATINVFAMMGGVTLRVPDEWAVVSGVTAILGGVEDKARPEGEPAGTLVLEGVVIMGSVEIKN